jgi:hypothetical protein
MTKTEAAITLAAALADLGREQSDANAARVGEAVAVLAAPAAPLPAPDAQREAAP